MPDFPTTNDGSTSTDETQTTSGTSENVSVTGEVVSGPGAGSDAV